jgi:hypothetical protein
MKTRHIARSHDPERHHSGVERPQLARLPAHPAGAIERPEPTRHAARHPKAFGPSRASARGSPHRHRHNTVAAPMATISGMTT